MTNTNGETVELLEKLYDAGSAAGWMSAVADATDVELDPNDKAKWVTRISEALAALAQQPAEVTQPRTHHWVAVAESVPPPDARHCTVPMPPRPDPAANAHAGMRLLDLIGRYWDIAYSEGENGSKHDDPDGTANKTYAEIRSLVQALAAPIPASDGQQAPECTGARAVAAEQAEDAGLWFVAQTASEAYLQAALRRLAAAVEAECAGGGERKPCGYWNGLHSDMLPTDGMPEAASYSERADTWHDIPMYSGSDPESEHAEKYREEGRKQARATPGPVAAVEPAPVGWKLVPTEPTFEMLMAMDTAFEYGMSQRESALWKAALNAAPAAPGPKVREPLTNKAILDVWAECGYPMTTNTALRFARGIEASHGIAPQSQEKQS